MFRHNEIVSNLATGNAVATKGSDFDLSDITPACVTDSWVLDTFRTTNQRCIQ